MKRIITAGCLAAAAALTIASPSSAGTGGEAFSLDVVVVGGTATSSDFSHDLVLVSPQVTGIVDPSPNSCTPTSISTNCSPSVTVPAGTYSVQGNTVPGGYVQTGFSCASDNDGTITDVTGTGSSFDLGQFRGAPTLCTITYTYATQQIAVDLTVVNDDGGTATAADFTIELRDSSNAIVGSGVDPEPGTGNASLLFNVPLGEYTITVSGPGDYVITINETTVDRDADLVVIDTFTVTQTQTVNAQIVANDPTTTTTTTTTVPPATTTPTTPATTNPVAVLPETGPSDSSLPLALVATALVALGGGAIALTRRR